MEGVEPENTMQATEFMHNAGVLLHFNTPLLHDIVVIDPQWLADIMATVVTFSHTWVKSGILVRKELEVNVWKATYVYLVC